MAVRLRERSSVRAWWATTAGCCPAEPFVQLLEAAGADPALVVGFVEAGPALRQVVVDCCPIREARVATSDRWRSPFRSRLNLRAHGNRRQTTALIVPV